MRTIYNMLQAVEKMDMQYLIESSLVDSQEDYVKLQKDQMLNGMNVNDEKIGRYKSNEYASKKYQQNSLAGFGNVDLRLHGPFHGGIFADVREDVIVVDSLDAKSEKLMAMYSDKIFGLGPTRIPMFQAVVHPRLLNSVEDAINKQ